MVDELIFILALNIIGIWFINYFDIHDFGIECVLSTLIFILIIYQFKNKDKK